MKGFCDIGGILEWGCLAMPRWDADIWKKMRKRWKNKPCTYQWEGVPGKGKKKWCKGYEVKVWLECSKNIKDTGVAEEKWARTVLSNRMPTNYRSLLS